MGSKYPVSVLVNRLDNETTSSYVFFDIVTVNFDHIQHISLVSLLGTVKIIGGAPSCIKGGGWAFEVFSKGEGWPGWTGGGWEWDFCYKKEGVGEIGELVLKKEMSYHLSSY